MKKSSSVTFYRVLFFVVIGSLYFVFLGKPRGTPAAALLQQYAPAEECVTNPAVALPAVGMALAELAALPGGFYRLDTNSVTMTSLRSVCGEGVSTIWIRPDRQIWLCPDRPLFRADECWVLVRRIPGPALLADLGRDRPLADLVEQFGPPRTLAVTRRGFFGVRDAITQLTAAWQSVGEGADGMLGAVRVEYDLAAQRGHWRTIAVRTGPAASSSPATPN